MELRMIESKNTMSLLMVMVTFTWALSGIATKYLSFYISENEIVVYRYFFAVLSTFPVLWWMKIPLNINKKKSLIIDTTGDIFNWKYALFILWECSMAPQDWGPHL